jgi:hypothetical protein
LDDQQAFIRRWMSCFGKQLISSKLKAESSRGWDPQITPIAADYLRGFN